MATSTLIEKVVEEVRSGLVSSVVAEAALFPLDAVKLRQQVHGGSALKAAGRILSERGVVGLYQGLVGRLIQTITSNVGFFIWQTLLKQVVSKRPTGPMSTSVALVVNMLAQQFNRILTTPVDVVANVNQADPSSRGFFRTFARLARTGGRATLWRGLGVSLLLSLNPALMYTLVGKISAFVSVLRNSDDTLGASDMFWISGVSKTVATLLTYPLIRAKAVIQTSGAPAGLWVMLARIWREEGAGGLYSGVWIMSYKTVLFNSIMMALKQKVATIWARRDRDQEGVVRTWSGWGREGVWRQKVSPCRSEEKPWAAAGRRARVVYVDGSWSFLHEAQEHLLRKAAALGDHLVVGIHSDECHHAAVGTWPAECFAARLARLRESPLAASILEDAPWEVTEELVRQLGVTKVAAGSVTKLEDCSPPGSGPQPGPGAAAASARRSGEAPRDPYAECKRLGIFEEVESLNRSTEHDAWIHRITRVVFSNVDASIDWRILVKDGPGQNPGYSDNSNKKP